MEWCGRRGGVCVVVSADRVWGRFFFFKQKTAYEVRISDWSSDGCSSDLPGRQLLADLCRKEEPRTSLHHPEADDQRGGQPYLDGERQIGRASCRERVCQYV